MIKEFSLYFLAAFFEILGCYSFWVYFKLGKSYWFLILGVFSLIAFAYALTRVNLEFAGRAYAIYGGIYIVSSLLWLYFVEKQEFNRWDLLGSFVILIGVCIILLGNQK
ncbi:MAG: YnfA family protein [Arcobacter sp.]|uniref:YnfA family protein n=1 Tax=Arcobacter sp. TaxID=1872629 RepID=UPI003CFCC80D